MRAGLDTSVIGALKGHPRSRSVEQSTRAKRLLEVDDDHVCTIVVGAIPGSERDRLGKTTLAADLTPPSG